MNRNGKDTTGERLDLQSRMSELARLPAWIERLAAGRTIPANTQFAMNLCLEEALSNIIRHGYSGDPGHSIAIRFTNPRDGYFVFEVEDEAPPFNPVVSPELPAVSSLEENQIGGQGIRLLRQFADALEYQATPTGNRLSIGFVVADSSVAKD
jgi:anti-sigma regulatory factor (Ser/Thr protein kinase)